MTGYTFGGKRGLSKEESWYKAIESAMVPEHGFFDVPCWPLLEVIPE